MALLEKKTENRLQFFLMEFHLLVKCKKLTNFWNICCFFPKRTLNALPYGYLINYRYVGSIKNENPNENFYVFEDIRCLFENEKRKKKNNITKKFV